MIDEQRKKAIEEFLKKQASVRNGIPHVPATQASCADVAIVRLTPSRKPPEDSTK